MGRHKVWRAEAKKMRRKRLRQKAAQERDRLLELEQEQREKSPRYQAWLKEQEELEVFQREEEERLQLERNLKWVRDERQAQILWRERQERLAKAQEERAKQELRIREEWEQEQKKVREAEEEARRTEEEKKRRQDELMKHIDEIMHRGEEVPSDMILCSETHPDKPPCPFFSKTGACRFGDWCSRNHRRPAMSKVLLVPNFYSHFGLEQALVEEYDTDVMLEYGDIETYQHFKDFFEDVLPEFERHGRVVQFKVCRNFEPHLRGNVYVEFERMRDAVAAYKKFQARWYGGKQLNIEFTCVSSWCSAVCGLYFKQRCPKGRSCNFLHVFRNPGGVFDSPSWRRRQPWAARHRRPPAHRARPAEQGSPRPRSWSRSPSPGQARREKRNWRWSESPEPMPPPPREPSPAPEHSHQPQHRKERRRKEAANRSSERSHQRHSSSSRSRDSGAHRKKHRRRSPGSS